MESSLSGAGAYDDPWCEGRPPSPAEVTMRIAITGATGFLGRYLVRHLAGAGHRLRCWHRAGSDLGGFGEVAGGQRGAAGGFAHGLGPGEAGATGAGRPAGTPGRGPPPQASRWFDLVGRVVRGGERVESARGGKEVHALDVARAAELLLGA